MNQNLLLAKTPSRRPDVFAPAGSFGRKMTMDDLMAKQMKVTRQENPHCELVSFNRDAANVFQQYMNESLAFGVKRGGFMYGVVTEEGKVTMATFLPIRPTPILSPFQDRSRLPIPTHPLLYRTQYNNGYGGIRRKQFHRREVGVVRFGFRPPHFLMDSDGAAEGVIKELFGRAKSVLYTIADAAVSSSDTVSTTKQSNDWLSGITYYMESVLKAKLPSVLRIYRDTLTTYMKTSIKTAVAELLPILVTGLLESDFSPGEQISDADGGGSSLASKLRGLSSESFVQLLTAIFKIVRAHLLRVTEVKKAIEWIMSNLDGHYAADHSVAAAIALGASAAETAQETDGHIGSLLPYSPERNATKVPSFQGKANDAASPTNMSRNFR